jgi:hypothetical protein
MRFLNNLQDLIFAWKPSINNPVICLPPDKLISLSLSVSHLVCNDLSALLQI